MHQVSSSYSLSLSCHLLVCFFLPCHHVHHIIMFFKTCIRSDSPGSLRCPFGVRTSHACPSPLSDLSSCASVKCSRNGPSLAKQPWYSTVDRLSSFRAIWRSFDAPTVNRVARNLPFVLQPNSPPNWPKTHPNPLHPLGHSIMIEWPKTAPHLDSPSSLYL